MCFCCVMLRPLNHRGSPCPVSKSPRVAGTCQAWIMCRRHLYLVPDQSRHIRRFSLTSKEGLAPSSPCRYRLELLCHQSAHMRLRAVVKAPLLALECNFSFMSNQPMEPPTLICQNQRVLSSTNLEATGFYLSKQRFPRPSHLTGSDAPPTA